MMISISHQMDYILMEIFIFICFPPITITILRSFRLQRPGLEGHLPFLIISLLIWQQKEALNWAPRM